MPIYLRIVTTVFAFYVQYCQYKYCTCKYAFLNISKQELQDTDLYCTAYSGLVLNAGGRRDYSNMLPRPHAGYTGAAYHSLISILPVVLIISETDIKYIRIQYAYDNISGDGKKTLACTVTWPNVYLQRQHHQIATDSEWSNYIRSE